MEVAVLTRDLMFFSAVEGVAGAMGHRAVQHESLDALGDPGIIIADLGSLDLDPAALAAHDPLRTHAFAPHVRTDLFAAARAAGLQIYRRGALATELPRLLTEYST
ncbi:MAG: hypothetical protein ACM3S1_02200 [Hyphomicrobiales bacterium]